MIFLGILFPKTDEEIIRSKSYGNRVQNQVNTFQWNCIEGFYQNLNKGIQIINVLPVGTFPFQYRDLILKSKKWLHNGETHYQVGSVNLPFFKQYIRYKRITRILEKTKEREIILYSTYLPFLKAVQKLDPSYHVKLIVTDLPEFYDYSNNVSALRRYFRKRNNRKIYKCLKRVDSFVLLTEQMREPLKIGERPYVVVEGIAGKSGSIVNNILSKSLEKKTILYTGSLDKMFGIDILLEAFSLIKDEDYELWICGAGDYESELKKQAINDRRIKFFGYVSKDESERKQREAAILINPRQNTSEYTKYSFPSKTMEYLSSGKPFIAYKLDGIPDEYDAFINYVEDNSSEALKNKIVDVMEHYDFFGEKAYRAAEFIVCKGPKEQTQKILNLGEKRQKIQ